MNNPLHIVVVNSDPSLGSRLKDLGEEEVVHVNDLQELGQASHTRAMDVLVLGDGIQVKDLSLLGENVDLSNTIVLAGPVPLEETVMALRGLLENGNARTPSPAPSNVTLEDYVESKFSEFVRAMKVSSARSLYSTLIHAVERPMIEMALRETNGNQIQAAQLLGLNRNTLRKKISECKISVKRQSQPPRTKVSS